MRTAYPWRHQAIAALPTLIVVAALYLWFGSETAMAAFFAEFRHAHPTLTAAAAAITDFGNPVFYTWYAWLLVRGIADRRERDGYRFALAYAISFAVTLSAVYFIKGAIGRARPYLEPEFRRFNWTDDFHSFPSGHTTEAVISAAPLAMRSRRYGRALAFGLAAACVALTRVYLTMHFMTDIVGGVVMGSFGAWLVWVLYTRLPGRQPGASAPTPTAAQESIMDDFTVANEYLDAGDGPKAMELFHRAAERGQVAAMHSIAHTYLYGIAGIAQDYDKAFHWFTKAASNGCPQGMYHLGICNANGYGTPKNPELALDWFQKSAARGDEDAEYQVGRCYENGIGTAVDIEEAKRHYRAAAAQGQADAEERLRDLEP